MSETQGPGWGPDVTTYVSFVDVSRVLADCAEGKYGTTRECQIANIRLSMHNGTDTDKVRRYTLLPEALNAPVLVADKGGDGGLEVVDGHHRITARVACGLLTVTAYVVPAETLRTYSVPAAVAARVGRAVRDEVIRAWIEEDAVATNKRLKKASNDSIGQRTQPISKSELRNE